MLVGQWRSWRRRRSLITCARVAHRLSCTSGHHGVKPLSTWTKFFLTFLPIFHMPISSRYLFFFPFFCWVFSFCFFGWFCVLILSDRNRFLGWSWRAPRNFWSLLCFSCAFLCLLQGSFSKFYCLFFSLIEVLVCLVVILVYVL